MNKISKGTIVRTVMLVIVLVNMALKALGKPLINIDEGSVGCFIEYAFNALVMVVSFWKNNSFSKAAIKADELLNKLKKEKNDLVFETQIEDNDTVVIDTEVEEDVESI